MGQNCAHNRAGMIICEGANEQLTVSGQAADPWAMPVMPHEADRWVDPGICGPDGGIRAVGPCSKRVRADGNADLLDANDTFIGTMTPNVVSCGPARDFIPGPCVSRPLPDGSVAYHDANGRKVGVGSS